MASVENTDGYQVKEAVIEDLARNRNRKIFLFNFPRLDPDDANLFRQKTKQALEGFKLLRSRRRLQGTWATIIGRKDCLHLLTHDFVRGGDRQEDVDIETTYGEDLANLTGNVLIISSEESADSIKKMARELTVDLVPRANMKVPCDVVHGNNKRVHVKEGATLKPEDAIDLLEANITLPASFKPVARLMSDGLIRRLDTQVEVVRIPMV